MPTIAALLQARLRAALPDPADAAYASVQPSADMRFGDYQSNTAMVLAKKRRVNPRQLAQEIVARLEVSDLGAPPEIAGAGFINFRLRPEWLARQFTALLADADRLGVELETQPRTVVIDFSSPNVAKPMHIGHIRSTILGDALARIATFLGRRVIRDNHIGDWGTQFGMLLLGWKTELNREALLASPLDEMERLYKLISSRKEDPATMEAARAELVKLQGGDEENLALWHEMIRLSQRQFAEIYSRLGVRFDVTLGESFYNASLQPVVEELRRAGIARESAGALCVFSEHEEPVEGDPFWVKKQEGWTPNPAIVRKSDGGANYTTTDLATLRYRRETWAPDEIVYVTDDRQQLHFRQLFAIYARWQPEATAKLAHVGFGKILGEDGKPFKTRSGETVRLAELLDEAEERALKIVLEKNPAMPPEEAGEIARRIGLGAVKYADLLPNRLSDYVFSWDRMLSLQGNTAPYLQNAYVRICSIFRKAAEAGVETGAAGAEELRLGEPEEIGLAKKLLQFGEVLPQVLEDYRPNLLANYLFELANTFHGFYEACPVLKAEGASRETRLALCTVTARVLKKGLDLLGIEVPERM